MASPSREFTRSSRYLLPTAPDQSQAAARACLSPSEAHSPLSDLAFHPSPLDSQRTLSLQPRALHPTCKLGPSWVLLASSKSRAAGTGHRLEPRTLGLAKRAPRPSGGSGRRPRPFWLAPLDLQFLLRAVPVWSVVGIESQPSSSQGLSLVTRRTQPPRLHKAVLSDFEGKLHNRCEAPHSWGVGISWTLPTPPNSVRPELLFSRVFESKGGLFSNEDALRVGAVQPLHRTHWTPEPGPWTHLTGQRRKGDRF